jgi:hypothetical protein
MGNVNAWQEIRTGIDGWIVSDQGQEWFTPSEKTTLAKFALCTLEDCREKGAAGMPLSLLTEMFRNTFAWERHGLTMPPSFKALGLWDAIYATVERAARAAYAEPVYCLGYRSHPDTIFKSAGLPHPKLTQAQKLGLEQVAAQGVSGEAAYGPNYPQGLRKVIASKLLELGLLEYRHLGRFDSFRLYLTARGREVLQGLALKAEPKTATKPGPVIEITPGFTVQEV